MNILCANVQILCNYGVSKSSIWAQTNKYIHTPTHTSPSVENVHHPKMVARKAERLSIQNQEGIILIEEGSVAQKDILCV